MKFSGLGLSGGLIDAITVRIRTGARGLRTMKGRS
jgi:hypothetical protein